MPLTMAAALEAVVKLVDQKRFRSAREMLERLHAGVQHPQSRVVTAYQCGALAWAETGDGMAARTHFQSVADLCRTDPQLANHPGSRMCWANSCENMMLLSLSYDEYENWAKQLASLQPDNPILHDHWPKFRDLVERGYPWVDALQMMATTYYSRNDPKADRGQYGCAASTWQVILTNRQALRLTREDWGVAVYEHAALTMRIAGQAGLAMEQMTRRPAETGEYKFIVEAAVPFVDEYLTANPDDATIRQMRDRLREFLSVLRSPVPAEPSGPSFGEGRNPTPGAVVTRHICERCRRVLGTVTRAGGDPRMTVHLPGHGGRSLGMCPHCGGQVRAVTDDEPGSEPLPLGCCLMAVPVCTAIGWLVGRYNNEPTTWQGGLIVGLILGGMLAVMSLLQRRQQV